MELWEQAWEAWGSKGVPVFPCAKNKRPLCKWRNEASCEKDKIQSLFEGVGNNAEFIGASMGEESGLFALDFDLYKEADATDFHKTLTVAGLLPETKVHRTKSGGLHYLFFAPGNISVPRNSVPSSGVEVRGEGGYIIVPPSPGYTVEHNVTVADAPPLLIKRLEKARKAFNNSTVNSLKAKIVSGDAFHEALTMIAAKLHGSGKSASYVTAFMLEAMESSVAANPRHHRHERWLAIMEGKDNELARISNSAFEKFNPNRNSHVTVPMATDNNPALAAAQAAGAALFAGSTAGDVDNPQAVSRADSKSLRIPADDSISDAFPFSNAYNAADVTADDDKDFLVFPLIMESDVIVLSAAPKAGKTLTAMTMCLHMAAGMEWGDLKPVGHDGKAAQLPVIYFAMEGQGAIRKRIRGWRDFHRDAIPNTLPLHVVEGSFNLADAEQRQEVVDKLILSSRWLFGKGWGRTKLIVIDTLTKAMPGKDQNSVEDTSAVFEIINELREYGEDCAIMFIHHDNRQGKGPRGSGNILAEPDTILSVVKEDAIVLDGHNFDSYSLSVYMARSVDDSQVYRMAAHRVDLGKNRQGIMETAPVLEMLEQAVPIETSKQAKQRDVAQAGKALFYMTLMNLMLAEKKMVLRLLHKSIMERDDGATMYYVSFLNGTKPEQLRASWNVLVAKEQLPPDSPKYAVEGDSLTMEIS